MTDPIVTQLPLIANDPLKSCKRCKTYKPIHEFWNDKHKPDGRRNQCKECSKKIANRSKSKKGHKYCSVCEKERCLDDFHKRKQGKLGRSSRCKYCVNAYWDDRVERGEKLCRSCGEIKNSSEFHKRSDSSKDGHRARCASCMSESNRRWYFKDPDRRRKVRRNYYHNNRERVQGYNKKSKIKRKDYIRESNRKCYQNNKDHVRIRNNRWRLENSDKVKEYSRIRRAKIMGVEYSSNIPTIHDILEKQGGRCANCRKKYSQIKGVVMKGVRVKFTIEHINPLSLGGGHTIDNIEVLCIHCNSRKNNKTPSEWARENGRLL